MIPKSVKAKTQPSFTPLLIGKGSEVDPSKDRVPLMFSYSRRRSCRELVLY